MYEQLKDPGFLLKRICEMKEHESNLALKSLGLTVTQARILGFLYYQEGQCCTLKDLERAFSVAQSTVVGTIFRMERNGMVQGFPDKTDRRVKWVRLTEKGLTHCKECEEHIAQSDAMTFACLSEEDRGELLRLLTLIYNALNENEQLAP